MRKLLANHEVVLLRRHHQAWQIFNVRYDYSFASRNDTGLLTPQNSSSRHKKTAHPPTLIKSNAHNEHIQNFGITNSLEQFWHENTPQHLIHQREANDISTNPLSGMWKNRHRYLRKILSVHAGS